MPVALEILRKPVAEVDILRRMLPQQSFVGQARRSPNGDAGKVVKDKRFVFVRLYAPVRRNVTRVRQSDIAE